MRDVKTRVYYLAEWVRDDALTEDGFESDCIEQARLDDFVEAKEIALWKALNSPMYWARVTKVEDIDGMKEYGPKFVNEWVNGSWTGWYEDQE